MTQYVRVSIGWRGTILASGAVLKDVDQGGGFLQGEAPLPVWTPLILSLDDDPEVAVEARVTQIVEACRTRKLQPPNHPGMVVEFLTDAEGLLGYVSQDAGESDEDERSAGSSAEKASAGQQQSETAEELATAGVQASETDAADYSTDQAEPEPPEPEEQQALTLEEQPPLVAAVEEDEPIQLRAGELLGSTLQDRSVDEPGSAKVIVDLESSPDDVEAAEAAATATSEQAAVVDPAAEEELEAADDAEVAAAAGDEQEDEEEGPESEEGEDDGAGGKKKRRSRGRRKKKRK